MICILEGWAGHALTLVALAAGATVGTYLFEQIAGIGERRYPGWTMERAHHRQKWSIAGAFAGLIAALIVAVVVGQALRPAACAVAGTWVEDRAAGYGSRP